MDEDGRALAGAVRHELAADLSRRDFIGRAAGLGLGSVVLGALPFAERMARPDSALAQAPMLADATLQAFFDTIIPGKPVRGLKTELGHPIHRKAIAGVDSEHGAVFTDALLLAHHPKIGFDALEPAFLARARELLPRPGRPVSGPFATRTARQSACGGSTSPTESRQRLGGGCRRRLCAFCAAANVKNATRDNSAGYRVMGHPGTAPHGYDDFSYGRRLNRGRTRTGSLP